MPPRVTVDANALDRDGTRDALVDRFLALVHAGAVEVIVAGGVRDEVSHPRTPRAVQDAILPHPSRPRPPALTHDQKLARIRVRAVLRGDTGSDKHDADAAHLSEAAEAGCTVFITEDKRILRRRADLQRVLPGLQVVTLVGYLGERVKTS